MADKTIVALYDEFSNAITAIRDLEAAGFPHEEIGFVANNAENRHGAAIPGGAVAGTAESGFSPAGLGASTIPGIGPVLASGPIVADIAGPGVGPASGLVSGLIGLGVPEPEAQVFAEAVRRGGALVAMRVPADRAGRSIAILERHDAVDLTERSTGWRGAGWRSFDPKGDSWSVSRIEEGRGQQRRMSTTGGGTTTGAGFAAERGAEAWASTGSGAAVCNAEPVPPGDRERPEQPEDDDAATEAIGEHSLIREEADTAELRGGPEPTAMSGMFGSVENDENLVEQTEPLKRGDTGRSRVRSYESPEDLTPGERVQRIMERDAAGDKPRARSPEGGKPRGSR